MAKIGSLDFDSKDPSVQRDVDAMIWRMRTKDRMRPDQIDMRLGCAPKRVVDALARPNPNEIATASVANGELEAWQFPEPAPKAANFTFTPKPKPEPETPAENGKMLSAAKAKVEPKAKPPSDRAPPTERKKRGPKPGYKRASPRLQAVVEETRAKRAAEALPEAPSQERAESCKPRIETVMKAAYRVFRTDRDELLTKDRNVRMNSCRSAILLVLNHEGIGPEVVAPYFDRSIAEAFGIVECAKPRVSDKSKAVNYFTQELCKDLGVDFQRLQLKLL